MEIVQAVAKANGVNVSLSVKIWTNVPSVVPSVLKRKRLVLVIVQEAVLLKAQHQYRRHHFVERLQMPTTLKCTSSKED